MVFGMDKKNCLLIVDDDAANLMELTHILRPEFKIYVVKDGISALEKVNESLPDLILLDVIMPNMSGFDVLRELKKSDRTKKIPVIFITGINENENESEGLAIGAVDYIRKPFDATVVRLRVNNQIQIINLQRDLENAVTTAETANRSKSAFLANMSHEIRTPMNAIMGVTEILMQNKLSKEIEEGLNKIYNSCDLLLGIINDILDFSKIEAGKLDIMPAQYKLASMINDSVHLNMMRIDSKPIDFELQVDENIPAKLIGDELRIKQILNNLLSNAFKYTDTGKVILSVEHEPAGPDQQSVTLVFSVRDTGHGMTKEQMGRLFAEYARFHQEKNTAEGTGLGLSITQSLVSLMEGEILVESEPGVGSLFTVRLPQGMVDDAVLGEEVAANLRQFRLNYMTNGKRGQIRRDPMPYGRILIVDDVETNLYVAMGLMKPYMLQLEAVHSGREAIEKIKSGKVYDIVFMDHMMPLMDGIEATAHIRELGYAAPIVALTANAVAGQAEIFLQNGFDDFISKPIDIRQLNAVLNKYVRDKQPAEVIEAARRLNGNEEENKNGEQSEMDSLLLDSIIRDIRKAVDTLEELSKKTGWEENEEDLRIFTVTVHGMKSSLLNVGEKPLSESARKLEQASRDRKTDIIAESTPIFVNELRALQEKHEKKRDDKGADGDTDELINKLHEIQKTCSEYNRLGTLDIISGMNYYSIKTRTVVDKICALIHNGDFEDAENMAAAYAADLKGPAYGKIKTPVKDRKITGLDIAKGLKKYNGDEEIYLKILRSYAVSTRSILSAIDLVGADNLADYKLKVHSMKGTSLDIFADQIGNAAARLEQAAKDGDLSYISEHNPAFLEDAWKVIRDLDAMLLEISAENPKPKRDKPDKKWLLKLLDACSDYDMDGVEAAMAEIEKYQYASDGNLVDWLRNNADMMNFSQIVKKLSDRSS